MTLRLLVGFDDSPASRNALAYVAPLVQAGAVDVGVITAASRDEVHNRLLEAATGVLGREPVHYRYDGTLYQGMLDTAVAERPDLVVYGEQGRTWTRWAQSYRRDPLYEALPMSSLLIRDAARPVGNILICAGGDDSIRHTAAITGQLFRGSTVRATVLHVLSQVPLVFRAGSPRERVVEAFAATGAPEMKYMQAAVEDLDALGIHAEIKIRIGLVVEEVASELTEGAYDLLVIGAHRSHGLVERFLLEDVAANILGKNAGPVLIIKQAAD